MFVYDIVDSPCPDKVPMRRLKHPLLSQTNMVLAKRNSKESDHAAKERLTHEKTCTFRYSELQTGPHAAYTIL